jgi:hypothetical protein
MLSVWRWVVLSPGQDTTGSNSTNLIFENSEKKNVFIIDMNFSPVSSMKFVV